MEELSDRIRKIRDLFKIKSQKDLSFELLEEISSTRIADLESGRTASLKVEEAILFQKRFNINPWWLMSGQGNMQTIGDETQYFRISIIGTQNQLILDQNLFKPLNLESALDLIAIKIKDDNMSPTIEDDGFAVVHRSTRYVWEHQTNGLYGIRFGLADKIVVRRIQFLVNRDIRILNDNPLYPPIQTTIDDVEWLGMVVLIIKN